MDLTKLSPGPLRLLKESETVVDAAGAAVCHFFHGGAPEWRKRARADAESYILARQAFDVWLQYRFTVYAVDDKFNIGYPEAPGVCIASDANPFAAILAARDWYAANVEQSPAVESKREG